ncbi:sigma-70 family RNA polymerase sigma factor [Planctomicrobium sp. SH668]|uniref:sigma-70 family RNA polymerase sigma factor n=1 Tax=Planctomicrobium sp. SH668 TaxID=3448126 RepID=UPI003F5AEEEC
MKNVLSPPLESQKSNQAICYIDSIDFKNLTLERLDAEEPVLLYQGAELPAKSSDTTHLLLTPAAEAFLFKKLNFLKHCAEKLRKGSKGNYKLQRRGTTESFLTDALRIRDVIIGANLRLVMGLAHQYSKSAEEFDDFVSEGNLILMNAVDKFDYSRGFRFSTYATYSIQRHYFRVKQQQQRRKMRERHSDVEQLGSVASPEQEEPTFTPAAAHQLIQKFEECLNPRERLILEERFGLKDGEAASLKSVAEKVGLSKERVRQLQMGALEKLQSIATTMRLHPETCL